MNVLKLRRGIIKTGLLAFLICGPAWADADPGADEAVEEHDLPQTSIDVTLIIRASMPEDLWPKHITKINCMPVDQKRSKCNVSLDFGGQKILSLVHLKWDSRLGWVVCRRINCDR